MNMTVTMTGPSLAVPPEHEVLRLRLLAPGEDRRHMDQRVAALVETMLASDHLSEKQKHNLSVWLRVNLPQFAPQAGGSPPEKLADILCSLLVDFISPLMLETDEEMALDEAVSFQKHIKGLLQQILPIGTDVDEYIYKYEEFNEEYLLAQESKVLANAATEDLARAEADAVWDRGGERFIATRGAFEEAILRREASADEVDAEVRSLTDKVKATASELSGLKVASEAQIERMRAQLHTAQALARASGEKLTMGAIYRL